MASVDAAKFWDKIAPKYARDPIKDMESYELTLDKTRGYLERVRLNEILDSQNERAVIHCV